MTKKKLVYLDHAATTPLDPQVLRTMEPFFSISYGNPSAIYSLGVEANNAVVEARKSIANTLHAQPDTIVFTSGGTESDNLAILGVAKTFAKPGLPAEALAKAGHIISNRIEHEAVLRPLEALEKQGWQITYVALDKQGLVKADDVIKAIRPDTKLISIMYANNEIGTIQPIADIGRAVLRYRKEHNANYPYFHTDACQAAGYLDLDVEKLHVDLMTINGGKIYGPKSTGCLYVRRGVNIEPIIYGGSQERGMRGGTENVAGVVGFAKALDLVQKSKKQEIKKTNSLVKYFFKSLSAQGRSAVGGESSVFNLQLNGPEIGDTRLPNNLNIQIPGIEGEALVIYLSEQGIMCSTGSACTAVTSEPSHVLRAIGCSDAEITSSVRFTLGKGTTKAEIDATIKAIKKIVALMTRKS